jgi:hypothetical protein
MRNEYKRTGVLRLNGVDIENHTPEYGFGWFNAIPVDEAGFKCSHQGVGHGKTKREAIEDLKRINKPSPLSNKTH